MRELKTMRLAGGTLAEQPDVRVVVLTGAGRAFSTGVDLKALASREMDKLFIAAINGHCPGGGLQLTLVCDYRLASEDALLGLPAVKECLIPSMALYRLPRLIGLARAKELISDGRDPGAEAARRVGL